jgi:hypothetical protein
MSDLVEIVHAFNIAGTADERRAMKQQLLAMLREANERVRLDQEARLIRQRRAPNLDIRYGCAIGGDDE